MNRYTYARDLLRPGISVEAETFTLCVRTELTDDDLDQIISGCHVIIEACEMAKKDVRRSVNVMSETDFQFMEEAHRHTQVSLWLGENDPLVRQDTRWWI